MAERTRGRFVESPMNPVGTAAPKYRGGPGVYNGEEGYPPRTPSPNAADEKTIDGSVKGDTNIPPHGED